MSTPNKRKEIAHQRPKENNEIIYIIKLFFSSMLKMFTQRQIVNIVKTIDIKTCTKNFIFSSYFSTTGPVFKERLTSSAVGITDSPTTPTAPSHIGLTIDVPASTPYSFEKLVEATIDPRAITA